MGIYFSWIFRQQLKEGEVSSSAIPHKVNPIDFENAEGNIGIMNALFLSFCGKLPISRWQAWSSHSTVLRNIGVAFGHHLLAVQSFYVVWGNWNWWKCHCSRSFLSSWSIGAETVQTILRARGAEAPYEKLKVLTGEKNNLSRIVSKFCTKSFLNLLMRINIISWNWYQKNIQLAEQIVDRFVWESIEKSEWYGNLPWCCFPSFMKYFFGMIMRKSFLFDRIKENQKNKMLFHKKLFTFVESQFFPWLNHLKIRMETSPESSWSCGSIIQGSRLKIEYFVMCLLSGLIATLGILLNDIPLLIAAMVLCATFFF